MTRRDFLLALAAPRARITQIRLARIEGRFHKFVAMNSQDRAPKGHTYSNTLLRIATDQGVEGVGVMGYAQPDAAFHKAVETLVGANPLDLYLWQEGRITGRASRVLETYKHLDGPLFDLIGKLAGVPCWKLIGPAARERVEVYDGTLYLSDVWFRDRGVRAVVEEAEEAWKSGYRGVKLKIGRGARWMEREAGLKRDIEVIQAVRVALGPKAKLLVDANNAFRGDLEGAWRLIADTAEAQLYWLEELFPEDAGHYARLRDRIERAGIRVYLADGENFTDPRGFEPYLKPRRLVDVLQMDIRTGGFLGNLETARLGQTAGALSVPHNWGSQVGLLMGLHLAKAAKSVIAAEDDRSTCDVIVAEGYSFRDGEYTVSDRPGLGIRVDEDVYRLKYTSGVSKAL